MFDSWKSRRAGERQEEMVKNGPMRTRSIRYYCYYFFYSCSCISVCKVRAHRASFYAMHTMTPFDGDWKWKPHLYRAKPPNQKHTIYAQICQPILLVDSQIISTNFVGNNLHAVFILIDFLRVYFFPSVEPVVDPLNASIYSSHIYYYLLHIQWINGRME